MKKNLCKSLRNLLITLLVLLSVSNVTVFAATIEGEYPTERGIILVTSDWAYGMIPSGHAAIVWDDGHVIEAQTSGVTMGLNNWLSNRKEVYGLKVKETTKA